MEPRRDPCCMELRFRNETRKFRNLKLQAKIHRRRISESTPPPVCQLLKLLHSPKGSSDVVFTWKKDLQVALMFQGTFVNKFPLRENKSKEINLRQSNECYQDGFPRGISMSAGWGLGAKLNRVQQSCCKPPAASLTWLVAQSNLGHAPSSHLTCVCWLPFSTSSKRHSSSAWLNALPGTLLGRSELSQQHVQSYLLVQVRWQGRWAD